MVDQSQYALFKKGLEQVGQVRRAWFTTFNLDIHFFERFVFPLLVGKDHKQLQTPLDYEALSETLDYENDIPEDGKLELHIFYDYRKLEQSSHPKLTTTKLHAINVADLQNQLGKKKFTGGIFHPKIALIENTEQALWLVAGSGNLTLSGWSRNSECLAFEPIKNTLNARPIGEFFSSLFEQTQSHQHPLLKRLSNGKGFGKLHGDSSSNWEFISSFQDKQILKHLAERNKKLTVWSPYFDAKLDKLIGHFPKEISSLDIVPAPNNEGRIGITEQAYKQLDSNNIRLMRDTMRSEKQFTHAKIWMCGNKLAIGSWNCTEAGLNLSQQSKNNIEAGIVYTFSDKESREISNEFLLKPINNPTFSTNQELEDDKEGILEHFTFNLTLELNWTSLKIKVLGSDLTLLQEKLKKTDVLVLPGIGKREPHKLIEGIDVRKYAEHFLIDRSYTFESAKGKVLYRGYLLESGLTERPVQRFNNLDDYLRGWIKGRPEEQKFRHKLNYQIAMGAADDLIEQSNAILGNESRNTWFTAFYAFDQIAYRIMHVKKTVKTKRDQVHNYIRLGRTLPGNLNELKAHLQKLIELQYNDEIEFSKSTVYLWFLIEKANAVFKLYNTEANMAEESISCLKNIDIDALIVSASPELDSGKAINDWKKFVIKNLNDWQWNP